MVLVSDHDEEGRERHRDVTAVEVVAVRWPCRRCEATVVGAPGALPSGWVELPPPPWNMQRAPGYGCPECAPVLAERSANQWAQHREQTYVVSGAEHAIAVGRLRSALAALEQLKFSGQRATDH